MLRRLLLVRRRGKMTSMHAIMRRFPERQFLLVGDSGERDPELYGMLARKYPSQVVGIYIRNLDARPMSAERCCKAFRDIPVDRHLVFRHINELPKRLPSPAK
jgi:phosphatidate phosphatase APP1